MTSWATPDWTARQPKNVAGRSAAIGGRSQFRSFATLPAGWEVQPPQPPHTSRRERSGAIEGRNQFRSFSLLPVGFEVQPPQPPHPRPERSGAVMIGDTGAEAKFVFVAPPIVSGYDAPTTQPRRPARLQLVQDRELIQPLVRFVPTLPEQQHLPSTRRIPRRVTTIPDSFWNVASLSVRYVPQTDHAQRSGLRRFMVALADAPFPQTTAPPANPFGFEPAPLMISLRQRRDAAIVGRNQFASFSMLPAGWEVQALQPYRVVRRFAVSFGEVPFPRTASAAVTAVWGSDAVLAPPKPKRWYATKGRSDFAIFPAYTPMLDDVPAQVTKPRPERGAAFMGRNQFASFSMAPVGWMVQPPQPPHPRRERFGALAVGDTGTEAKFIFVNPTVVWGYPFQDPMIRRVVRVLADRDDGVYGALRGFFNLGFEVQPTQPPHRRLERAAAGMRGDDGNEAPFVFVAPNFIPWGEDSVPVFPRVRFERSGAVAREPDDLPRFTIFRPVYQEPFLFPRRPIERRGAFIRGPDGTEAAFVNFRPLGWDPSEPVRRPRRGWHGPEIFEPTGNVLPTFLFPWYQTGAEQLIVHPRRGGALAIDTELPTKFVPPPTFAFSDWWVPETFYRRRYVGAVTPWEHGWFMRSIVQVFYASTVITQASGVTVVTAATAQTIVSGERRGQ